MSLHDPLSRLVEFVAEAGCALDNARELIEEQAKNPFVGQMPSQISKINDDIKEALVIVERIEVNVRKFSTDIGQPLPSKEAPE